MHLPDDQMEAKEEAINQKRSQKVSWLILWECMIGLINFRAKLPWRKFKEVLEVLMAAMQKEGFPLDQVQTLKDL